MATSRPNMQACFADFVHLFVYVLLIAKGIAGAAGWITSGDPVAWFGAVDGRARVVARARPALPPHRSTFAGVLMAAVLVHVLALIKHDWFDRDRRWSRMLPRRTNLLRLRPGQIVNRMRLLSRGRREARRAQRRAQMAAA